MIHFRDDANAFGVIVQDTGGDVYYKSVKRKRTDPFNYIPLRMTAENKSHDTNYNKSSNTNTLWTIPVSGEITYTFKYLINTLRAYITENNTDNVIKIPLQQSVTLSIPNATRIHDDYFPADEASFHKVFDLAFKRKLSEVWPKKSHLFPNVNLKLTVTDPLNNTSTASMIDLISLTSFRQLMCLLCYKLFCVKLECCACYPLNESEFIAWQSGIFKNCYSKECESYLKNNPYTYDSLFVGSCANATTNQIAIAYIKSAASKNLQINVHIKQLIDEYVKTLPSSTKLL